MEEFKKKIAFTISEAILTMVIIGLIVTLAVAGIKLFVPKDEADDTLAWKMAENIESATLQILLYHASYDDFTRIKSNSTYFSIEDKNVTKRISDLYSRYLADIDYNVDTTDEYFRNKIMNYDKTLTNEVLGDVYSEFYHVTDGMLIGFRLYEGCNNTEKHANPPEHKGGFEINNVCGSIFYDTNAFKGPNKLGSDQYILPISKKMIKYNNE